MHAVDLAASRPVERSIEVDGSAVDARESIVEFRVADEEGTLRLIDLLGERFGAECVLVGSPGERARCEQVAHGSRHRAMVAAGETGVGELIALLSLCAGFAGNDSGCMHVAGALEVPTVAVFGSTDPKRTGPLGPKTAVIYRGIECSPCLARTCRFGHYNCLTAIEAAEVASALADLGTFDPAPQPANRSTNRGAGE